MPRCPAPCTLHPATSPPTHIPTLPTTYAIGTTTHTLTSSPMAPSTASLVANCRRSHGERAVDVSSSSSSTFFLSPLSPLSPLPPLPPPLLPPPLPPPPAGITSLKSMPHRRPLQAAPSRCGAPTTDRRRLAGWLVGGRAGVCRFHSGLPSRYDGASLSSSCAEQEHYAA